MCEGVVYGRGISQFYSSDIVRMIAEEEMEPELGDLVTIVSKSYGSVTGRIIFRDEGMLRVKPYASIGNSKRMYDFPIDPETGAPQENLGIEQVQIHEKRSSPWYSRQLAILPDSDVLFYTTDASAPPERVHVISILATEEEDALIVRRQGKEDVETINFDFRGPPAPLLYIEPADMEVTPENNSISLPPESEEALVEPEFDITTLVAPSAIEEVPDVDKRYSSEEQIEHMMTSLLSDYDPEQHSNERIKRVIRDQALLVLSMIQSVTDVSSTTVRSMLEAIQQQPTGGPLNSIVPVANVRRMIYVDDTPQDTEQIYAQNMGTMFAQMTNAIKNFESTSENNSSKFIRYMLQTLTNTRGVVKGTIHSPYLEQRILEDQDVLRGPLMKTKGFVKDLPPWRSVTGGTIRDSIPLTQRYIGSVSNQFYRLLPSFSFKHPETGLMVNLADGDILEPLQYLLLPPSLAMQHCTATRSGVLVWDVQQSDMIRKKSRFSTSILDSFSREPSPDNVYEITSSMLLTDILKEHLPTTMYSFSDIAVQEITDGLGLRAFEWSEEIRSTVRDSLQTSQRSWTRSYDDLKKTLSSQPIVRKSIIESIAKPTSVLLTSIESNPLLQDIVKDIKAIETSLGDLDLVLVEGFQQRSGRTLEALWWSHTAHTERPATKDVEEPTEEMKEAEGTKEKKKEDLAMKIARSELERIKTVKERIHRENRILHAEPIQNRCEHVKELEQIRGIDEESDRLILLNKFINKYQADIKHNWIQCNICHQDLVCRHEIILIEMLDRYKRDILEKLLYREFGDVQVDSSYICKNCGMAIAEIDYDTGPEFDDQGNLMQGRTVLLEADLEDVTEVIRMDILDVIRSNEKENKEITKEKEKIYGVLQTLFQYAGTNPSVEMYKEYLHMVYTQILVIKDKYFERIAKKYRKNPQSMPDEDVLYSTLLISLSASVVIAELQISEEALPILSTAPGCTFSRNGVPRDSEGTGLLEYITCIASRLNVNSSPWNETLWAGVEVGESRTRLVRGEILYCIDEIKQLPMIADALQDARLRKKDRVVIKNTPIFRQRVDIVPAISNGPAFQASVLNSPFAEISETVIGRDQTLAQQIIQVAHQSAVETQYIVEGRQYRLDGQCCEVSLDKLGPYGFGIVGMQSEGTQTEISLLQSANRVLLQRSAISTVRSPWSAPTVGKTESVPDESLSFRLFLRACSTGPNAGYPHEYGETRICRQCGLSSPVELLNLQVDEEELLLKESEAKGKTLQQVRDQLQQLSAKRDAILKQALEEAGIKTDPESFLHLQDMIHLNHAVPSTPSIVSQSWIEQLSHVFKRPLASSIVVEWGLFKTFAESLTPATTKKERLLTFAPFSQLYPDYVRRITNQFKTLNVFSDKRTADETITKLFEHIHALQGSSSILISMFLSPLKQIASHLRLQVKGSKWFKSITPSHESLLQEIWKKQYDIIQDLIKTLEDDEPLQHVVETVLNRYTTYLGSILHIMNQQVRPNELIHANELQELLTWTLLSSLSALMNEASDLYATEGITPTLRKRSAAMIAFFITSLFQTIHSQRKQLEKTEEQITFAIDTRNQLERDRFITKQNEYSTAEKRADNLMKLYGIGDYSEGALKKNLLYDADYFEFHRNQRLDYGLPNFSSDISSASQVDPTLRPREEGVMTYYTEYAGQNGSAED